MNGDDAVMIISASYIDYGTIAAYRNLRPVVSIPIEALGTKEEEGSWQIIE